MTMSSSATGAPSWDGGLGTLVEFEEDSLDHANSTKKEERYVRANRVERRLTGGAKQAAKSAVTDSVEQAGGVEYLLRIPQEGWEPSPSQRWQMPGSLELQHEQSLVAARALRAASFCSGQPIPPSASLLVSLAAPVWSPSACTSRHPRLSSPRTSHSVPFAHASVQTVSSLAPCTC